MSDDPFRSLVTRGRPDLVTREFGRYEVLDLGPRRLEFSPKLPHFKYIVRVVTV